MKYTATYTFLALCALTLIVCSSLLLNKLYKEKDENSGHLWYVLLVVFLCLVLISNIAQIIRLFIGYVKQINPLTLSQNYSA